MGYLKLWILSTISGEETVDVVHCTRIKQVSIDCAICMQEQLWFYLDIYLLACKKCFCIPEANNLHDRSVWENYIEQNEQDLKGQQYMVLVMEINI